MTAEQIATDPAELVDLYLRLSLDREGKDSLERQEADLRAWAAGEGLVVRKVWTDRGISGFKEAAQSRRDGLRDALAALRNGDVKTLAVWKLDRLSRRGAGQIGTVLDEVAKVRGRVVFLKDNKDTSDDGDRLVIVLLSEIARSESANTSLRVKSSKATARKEGRYLGGLAPYGYRVNEERLLEPQQPEYGLMQELVRRILDGESLKAVCRDWNSRGLRTRRDGVWNPSTLSAALRSPGLAGLQTAPTTDEQERPLPRTEPYRDADGATVSLMAPGHLPIASESVQARLLRVMDGRLRRYGRGRRPVKQPKSLLGGIIRCATCGRPANTFGDSYRCRRWHTDGTDCAAPLSASVVAVESAVRAAWVRRLATEEPGSALLEAVARHWLEEFDPAALTERREVQHEVDNVRARIESADHAHFVLGTLDAERYASVTAGLQDRLSALSARLDTLPIPEADIGALLDPEISAPALESASVTEARALLRLAIEEIQVGPASKRGERFDHLKRVRIRWVGDEGD